MSYIVAKICKVAPFCTIIVTPSGSMVKLPVKVVLRKGCLISSQEVFSSKAANRLYCLKWEIGIAGNVNFIFRLFLLTSFS